MLQVIIIFLLELLYVSVMTCRWIILIRGSKYIAALVSFFEQILQVIALGMVMIHLNDSMRILAYALGYACGSIAGSFIEEKIAIGFTVFQIITNKNSDLAENLRCRGMGVTVWNAKGREDDREILLVVVRRKWGSEVLKTVDQIDSTAFVIRHDPQAFKGGFLLKYKKSIK